MVHPFVEHFMPRSAGINVHPFKGDETKAM